MFTLITLACNEHSDVWFNYCPEGWFKGLVWRVYLKLTNISSQSPLWIVSVQLSLMNVIDQNSWELWFPHLVSVNLCLDAHYNILYHRRWGSLEFPAIISLEDSLAK